MLDLRKLAPRSFDWVLAAAMFLLIILGWAAIYSVDLSRGGNLELFKKQSLHAGFGLILFFAASLMQYTWYRTYAKYIYGVTLLGLLAVLIFGTTIRGTRGWFNFLGFSFQPVELAKLGVILVLAYIIANFGRRFEKPLFFFGTAAVVGIAAILVLFQPDLGSVILLGSIWFGLMLLVGARRSHIFFVLFVGVVTTAVAWFWLLQSYQKDRILIFINPERDALGAGYNITQATIAIGAGQFLGRGLGFGSQSQLRFLPEAQTDFIFSVIAEELGFVGAATLVVLYGIILWRLIRIIKTSSDDFCAAACGGMAILFFVQFFINVGANLGLVPITGVPLPFVSYGGSSLITSMIMAGIAESMVEKKY
ncbi:MAG: rod shape-determining protein RodA [Candidatus Azambacteria bacterium]|nr:rod shape-determining protein RodA [Candidatus Azambacteria bacterium]